MKIVILTQPELQGEQRNARFRHASDGHGSAQHRAIENINDVLRAQASTAQVGAGGFPVGDEVGDVRTQAKVGSVNDHERAGFDVGCFLRHRAAGFGLRAQHQKVNYRTLHLGRRQILHTANLLDRSDHFYNSVYSRLIAWALRPTLLALTSRRFSAR